MRAESPAFSTLGVSSADLTFNFIANGDALIDNASVLFDAGSGWTVLDPSLKSAVCGTGRGQWTAMTIALPASALNQPSVRIAFNWTNNDDGIGTDPSVAIDAVVVTGMSVPDAPTIGTATAGDASASVTFTPPVSDGGSPITGYTATSTPGGFSSVGCTASPCTVSGLANGTAYSFVVTATNAVGIGLPSASSNSVTPAAVPGAPTIGTATAADASASVTFTPPADTGGSAITGYTAISTPGGFSSVGCTASPCTVTGLANGTAYTFVVTAANAVGTGLPSASSNSVTPAAVPGAPGSVQVVVAGTSANITWTAPANNGGSAITGYTVTSQPGGLTCTVTGAPPQTTCEITDLSTGTSYVFSVQVSNAQGAGPAASSDPVEVGTGTPVVAAPKTIPTLGFWMLLGLAALVALWGTAHLNPQRFRN